MVFKFRQVPYQRPGKSLTKCQASHLPSARQVPDKSLTKCQTSPLPSARQGPHQGWRGVPLKWPYRDKASTPRKVHFSSKQVPSRMPEKSFTLLKVPYPCWRALLLMQPYEESSAPSESLTHSQASPSPSPRQVPHPVPGKSLANIGEVFH